MQKEAPTKEHLLVELERVRQKIAELEAVQTERKRARKALGQSDSLHKAYRWLEKCVERITTQLAAANEALQAEVAERLQTDAALCQIERRSPNASEREPEGERMEEPEQHFRHLVENIREVFWVSDLNNQRLIYVSPAYEQIWGRSCQSLYQDRMSFLDTVHHDDRKHVAVIFERQARGECTEEEYRIVRPDGSVRWIRDRGFPIKDGSGGVYRIAGIAEDITGYREAEEALRRGEEQFRTLVESMDDIVFTLDREQRHIGLFGQWLEKYGLRPEQFLGKTVREVLGDKLAPVHEVAIGRALAGERAVYEWSIDSPQGTIWIQTSLSPIRDSDGKITGVVGVGRDVTERKQAEEALRQSEEQLRQSQKMEAIGRLAGGVAHDFNNMLTVINGYSDLLISRLAPLDPIRKDVEEIRRAGERASHLTRQLLAFSRRHAFQPEVLNLNAVITNMDKMLRRLIGEDIDLVIFTDPGLGRIKADPGQIEQVIMNLVVNARDAMPDGGKLTIETTNVEIHQEQARQLADIQPGSYVMLTVTDTGCGMDEKTKSHIFEPFFTTKEPGKGTGLGLSTVYGIVKQSGGAISVDSRLNQGTIFKIYLPRVDEAIESLKPGATRAEPTQGLETILLVEDEDVLRALICKILEMHGYTVLEARNGGESLLICEQHKGPIHLMVTDVVMPKMNGPSLAERLAQLRPDMKVIYMSGYTDNIIIHRGVQDLSTAFLQKPFTPDALARKVREVLDQRLS